jgi:curved DNA-binding protein CbpA
MDDPYDILGVRRGDSEETIRKAYRKLAKRHHPDLNPGKPEALERFKAINAANEILADPEKRARFDRGEIDGAGNERPPERPQYRDAGGGDFGAAPAGGGQYGEPHGLSPEDLAGSAVRRCLRRPIQRRRRPRPRERRALQPDDRLPRRRQRRRPPPQPAGRPHAGRHHPRRAARRPCVAAEGAGPSGAWRCAARRCAGGNQRRPAPFLPPRRK